MDESSNSNNWDPHSNISNDGTVLYVLRCLVIITDFRLVRSRDRVSCQQPDTISLFLIQNPLQLSHLNPCEKSVVAWQQPFYNIQVFYNPKALQSRSLFYSILCPGSLAQKWFCPCIIHPTRVYERYCNELLTYIAKRNPNPSIGQA